MKVSKVALSTARRIFRLCSVDGRMDESKLRFVIQRLVETKPRDYRGILQTLKRLVKAELDSKAVTVESASQLDPNTAEQLSNNLRQKYGQDLTFTFNINPELIGGMKIRIGNDVFDGSVKARLERLADAL